MTPLSNEIATLNIMPRRTMVYLLMLERALNRAIIQHERIKSDSDEIEKAVHDNDLTRMRRYMITLFSDIHHYLITWAEFDKLYHHLKQHDPKYQLLPADPPELREHVDFRNHLEHIAERIERGVSDLGNLNGDEFSFDGRTINIGDADLTKLRDIFKRLMAIAQADIV